MSHFSHTLQTIVALLIMLYSNILYADILISVNQDTSKISIQSGQGSSLKDVLDALQKETGITYHCPTKLLQTPLESNIKMTPVIKALDQLLRQFNRAFLLEQNKVIDITIIHSSSDVNEVMYLSNKPIANPKNLNHSQRMKKHLSAEEKNLKSTKKLDKMKQALAELESNGLDPSRLKRKIAKKEGQVKHETNHYKQKSK